MAVGLQELATTYHPADFDRPLLSAHDSSQLDDDQNQLNREIKKAKLSIIHWCDWLELWQVVIVGALSLRISLNIPLRTPLDGHVVVVNRWPRR